MWLLIVGCLILLMFPPLAIILPLLALVGFLLYNGLASVWEIQYACKNASKKETDKSKKDTDKEPANPGTFNLDDFIYK